MNDVEAYLDGYLNLEMTPMQQVKFIFKVLKTEFIGRVKKFGKR